MEKKNELVKVDAKQFGLTEKKAEQIKAQFMPMLNKMEELEGEYNKLIEEAVEITPEISGKARELRLKYVKIRTGTANIHKEQKAFYIAGGKYVDAFKNTQLFASQGIEDKLYEIENHFELIKQQEVKELAEKRIEIIKQYTDDYGMIDFGTMPDDVWDAYLEKKIKQKQEADEQKKLEEEQRIENEKKKKLDQQRREIALPFFSYWSEYEKQLNFADVSESDFSNFIERVEKLKKADDVKREKQEKENKAMKDKLAAIEKEKKEKEEKEEAEQQLGDKDKFKKFVEELEGLKTKYEFKSSYYKAKQNTASGLIDKIINHIKN